MAEKSQSSILKLRLMPNSKHCSAFLYPDFLLHFVQWCGRFVFPALILLAVGSAVRGDDFTTLCADRAALERVYYQHRLGAKPTFEEALPRATLESLVRLDRRKEEVLREHYGLSVTPAMLAAEVERINATTRAPEMLKEIKAALGNDPGKFANVFAKPILVERILREKFDNDDALHAGVRRECEQVRDTLLAAKTNGANAAQLLAKMKSGHSNAVTEVTWQLTPPPAQTNNPPAAEAELKKRFGPNAQILGAGREAEEKLYFAELPGELQQVLRAQLHKTGDVSAVIELPGGFLLYLAREKTDRTLSAAVLSLPKRSYEEWLKQ
jgi:hypothetical protein